MGTSFRHLLEHSNAGQTLKVISIDDMKQIPRDPQNQALLVYGGEELHQIPQEQIDQPFGRRAIWFTEDPYEAKRNQVSAKHFQIVFTTTVVA